MQARPQMRWQTRYTMVAMCAMATFICYIDRVNISIAIIPMAEEFGWDRGTQGLVLSSFFVGYLLTQIAGGWLADRFGGKVVLGLGVLFWSLFTLITPPAAFGGMALLLLSRVGMGLGEAVTFPSIYSLFARWLPITERTRAIGLNASAIPMGTVFALVLTPIIVLSMGWEWAFYLFGAVGIVWYVFWQRLAATDPKDHPGVSSDELALIQSGQTQEESPTPPPIRAMLSSMAVWAIIVSHFCSNWGGYVLLSWLPTYISEGLGVDFAAVGVFTMIPSVASFLFLNVAGWTTDKLISHGMDVTFVRKLMQAIGFGGGALVLAVVGYVQSPMMAIALMSFGSMVGAFALGGWGSNHMDLAPRHAGTLMGITNTAGTVPGIIGVFVSGLILEWTGSWILVFQVAAAINVFGLVFYLIFASTKKQFD
ncbi:MAG: ACS family MFS transporter [Pseudomonadales bacterium]|nr:ACS family MFS transporter [Pseudomonadales bacterium]MDP6472193.1 ACS family MFS transporter [Pseudomonadales bacterium]MDP6826555.1 ACS family MFS transporter [Pseudomonadales bacterium]MDP6970363.1 ACS family MFS transporter [Pseudomonadales bacterium]